MAEPLHYLSLAEVADLIRTRQVSPVEVTRVALDRIAALDQRLHAFITLLPDQALRQAEQATAEIAAGRYRGPLHGVPIAHKDIVWTKGIRTTAHSRQLFDWIPPEDAPIVTRLDEAGAVNLGKLSLHEFAFGTPGDDEAFPAALNPWDLERSPGGSSSGSGAAVAAGLCYGTIGTDTGGSIRHPAAVCGIVGLKPTYGRVPKRGVVPLSDTLDHVGPLTRTVRDNALMLQVLAGHDPFDPGSVDAPAPDFAAGLADGVRGLRIGVPEDFIAAVDHDPEALAAFAAARDKQRELGAEIRPVTIAGLLDVGEISNAILLYEAYQYHRFNLEHRPEGYATAFRDRVLTGAKYSEADYQAALRGRAALQAAYARVFADEVDLILTPGREAPAVTMADLRASPTVARGTSTRMYNVTGLPALVMPDGFTRAGLPLSLQIAGPPLSEPLIYRAAAAYEAATGWINRHPDLEAVTVRRT